MAKVLNILIVDDDAALRGGLRRLFHAVRNDMPSELHELEDGTKIMNLLEQVPIDCVIMDYQMPGGTGVEWLMRIQAAYPKLPVIILTGHAGEELAVEAMKAGAVDYLVKGSVSIVSLQRAVRNAVSQSTLARQIEEQEQRLREAEKQQVMVDSLNAACDHLNEPVHEMLELLHKAKEKETSPETLELLRTCIETGSKMKEVFLKLREISLYRVTPEGQALNRFE